MFYVYEWRYPTIPLNETPVQSLTASIMAIHGHHYPLIKLSSIPIALIFRNVFYNPYCINCVNPFDIDFDTWHVEIRTYFCKRSLFELVKLECRLSSNFHKNFQTYFTIFFHFFIKFYSPDRFGDLRKISWLYTILDFFEPFTSFIIILC